MAVYDVADGHNNTGGLTALTITATKPPAMTGFTVGRRRIAGNRVMVEDGLRSCVLQWGFLEESELSTLLSQLGVASATSNEITIVLPNLLRVATNYNATVIQPDPSVDALHVLGQKFMPVNIPLMFIEEI